MVRQLGAAWSGQEVCLGFALAARATRSRLGIRPRRLRYLLVVRALQLYIFRKKYSIIYNLLIISNQGPIIYSDSDYI